MDRVQRILRDLESADRGSSTLPEALCAACAAALPVTGVGLALMSKRGPEGLVAASDGLAKTMEDLQFDLGEGPCVDASSGGRPVLHPELRETGGPRWPAFAPAALQAGIEAVFAFPLQVGAIRLGVLDLYRDVPGTLSPQVFRDALAFSDAATRVLLYLQGQMPVDGALHPDLLLPQHDRPEVHQATGMIAVQAAVGLAEALLLLRARAFSDGRGIVAVARDVVSGNLRFHPDSEQK
ncbi:GAF domain-containing protein [Allobranchiibius sp. CTAmp26]|uniref:GAF domain-containing protein n=1 Tax=Allobranchiibius sp. CTAmp26 TaxID=2815214 RepID=UPI001AA14F01|nr:GAF domain-containing protein [Allobranchiibius sp. CTAmp26]MBO1754539.1 GAF domain-containing protein [Allobranchiibius sp. CTAmp26]